MGTIAEKIGYLKETKNAIKNAIIDKNVEVSDTDTFRSYADKIKEISTGGNLTPYQRPSDWLTIPTIDGTKDDIYVLNGAIKNGLNMIFIGLAGTGTIDWGDGNIESFNVTSETNYSHHFNYDDLLESSWTNHNRTKQALIHIYGNRGAITVVNFAKTYSYTNADGVTVNYDQHSSTDIYEIKADVENCDYTCSTTNNTHHLNLEIFDWKENQNKTSMSSMFANCYSLQSIPQLDTSKVTSMSSMFANCYSLQSIPQLDTSKVTSMSSMFANCYSLQSIPQLDTSKVTSMSSMFYGCYSLQSIPQLDTSKVTSMSSMFYGCYSLQSIPQLDTSKVTSMSNMFDNCYSLQSIPQLDTSKVTSMSSMFDNCYSLQSIPQLDTSKVTSMSYMFYNCYSLQSIPQLDTSKVTSMSGMFYGCYSLQSIPQLDTSKVTSMSSMFYGCYSLQSTKLYNSGASSQSSITLSNLSNSTFMTKQALVDLFNSVAPNNVEGNTRTLQLGTTLQGYLSDCYVKDSGIVDTYILPTSDTEIQSGKTYYIYNEITNTYSEVTPDFTTNTFYYELVTASWNKYIICESTDEGSMLALNYMTNIKKWTVT